MTVTITTKNLYGEYDSTTYYHVIKIDHLYAGNKLYCIVLHFGFTVIEHPIMQHHSIEQYDIEQ